MSEWPDEKVRTTALGYINKHVMNPLAWRATSVGEIHPKLTVLAELKSDELLIGSCFHSESSWSVLSTRRVVGVRSGQIVDLPVLDIVESRFGNFIKGLGTSTSELMRLRMANGRVLELEYETGPASMAPIYYFRFWTAKYPLLTKLKS